MPNACLRHSRRAIRSANRVCCPPAEAVGGSPHRRRATDDAPARIKRGPLSGKRIGLLAGPEFSDFQAYYLNLYLSELGARVCNLVIRWPEVGWKMSRPATSDTVQGTFGLRLDPIPTMAHGDRYTTLVFRDQSQLTAACVGEQDALIVLGGHSADVLRVDPAVTGFVADAWQRGVLVGALECGQMVLMSAGIIDGQRVTGYRVVRPFLSRLGSFVDAPVVVDGNLITARDSDATPRFVRALARYFQPDWEDPTVDLLAGKRIVIVAVRVPDDVPEFVDLITDVLCGTRLLEAATAALAPMAR